MRLTKWLSHLLVALALTTFVFVLFCLANGRPYLGLSVLCASSVIPLSFGLGIPAVLRRRLRQGLISDRRTSLRQKSPKTMLKNDFRSPVLFLRSFADDASLEGEISEMLKRPLVFEPSLEADIVPVLATRGPVIAVSQPGVEFSPIGACRLKLGDDWQADVHQMIKISQLVVIIMGFSPGVSIELRMAIESASPEELLLVFPAEIPFLAKQRWKLLRDVFADLAETKGVKLPIELPESPMYAYFSESWHVDFVSFQFPDDTHAKTLVPLLKERWPTSRRCTKLCRTRLMEIVDRSEQRRYAPEDDGLDG